VKKTLMMGVALGALLTAPALAADLPLKARPYAVSAPAFSWTGCYIGAHVGGGGLHDSWTGEHGNGALVGGQIGCNYQTGMLVVGAEAEGFWSGISSKSHFHDDFDDNSSRTKNKYDYNIAARLGVAIDRTFIYGKVGWTWGRFDFSSSSSCSSCEGLVTDFGRATLSGILLGAGFEYALTNNWTTKFEYNYLNYGSRDVTIHVTDSGCSFSCSNSVHTSSQSADKHIIKVGLNYKFN
jgi:outer membrane immunogenic protein